MTPAVCSACLHDAMYGAGRGMTLKDQRCQGCGKLGTLHRSGNTPALNAQAAFLHGQPWPDGKDCLACGGNDHQAFECALTAPYRRRFPQWKVGIRPGGDS